MFARLAVLLIYQSYVMCDLNISRQYIKIPIKTDNQCLSTCVTKCCPKDMVFVKVRDEGVSKSWCMTHEDGIFERKQFIHDGSVLKDFVYLPDKFDILFGKPCAKMYTANHPFYLQEVSGFI